MGPPNALELLHKAGHEAHDCLAQHSGLLSRELYLSYHDMDIFEIIWFLEYVNLIQVP